MRATPGKYSQKAKGKERKKTSAPIKR
jgi:hypothetical protein